MEVSENWNLYIFFLRKYRSSSQFGTFIRGLIPRKDSTHLNLGRAERLGGPGPALLQEALSLVKEEHQHTWDDTGTDTGVSPKIYFIF